MSTGNRTRRKAAGLLPEAVTCIARKKDGTPCRRSPIKGGNVCRAHGGAAPQVKAKAAERLREGVMPMLGALYRIAHDDTIPPAVQLAAVRDWLDRAGIKEAISVEVTVQPWERLIEGIVSEVAEGATRHQGALLAGDVVQGELVQEASPALPSATTAEPRIPSRRKAKGRR